MLSYVGHQQLPALRGLFQQAEAVFAAVAFVRRSGVALIQQEVEALHRRHGQLSLLTSLQFGSTEIAALDSLTRLGVDVRIHQGPLLHTKVYLAHDTAQAPSLLVGSANLTASALLRNAEAGLHLTGAEAHNAYPDAHAHLWPLWQQARPHTSARPLQVAQPPLQPPPLTLLQQQIVALQAQQPVVRTATGLDNHLLRIDPLAGVLVGTTRAPRGQWVPWEMFEVVEAWMEAHGRLRLNDGGGPDCTRYLRVHRSSAVFAIFGALPGYRLHTRRPVWLERL